jgi:hypothetical protein|tara:strand:- start:26 stop:556 length:531 start_codon:yes stop_codon:yes gene_type:complete
MHKNKLLTLLILISTLILFTGCNSNSNELDQSSENDGILTSRITNEGSVYVIADFETAGLKKPKSLKADAVDKKTGEAITPEATEVHLGFFKSSLGPKDVEVRFYKSHSDAITYGVSTAEKTINKVVAFTNALIETKSAESATSTSGYGAYIVTGNAIMICQGQIEVCDELLDRLK